jgi:hypothetical protein
MTPLQRAILGTLSPGDWWGLKAIYAEHPSALSTEAIRAVVWMSRAGYLEQSGDQWRITRRGLVELENGGAK